MRNSIRVLLEFTCPVCRSKTQISRAEKLVKNGAHSIKCSHCESSFNLASEGRFEDLRQEIIIKDLASIFKRERGRDLEKIVKWPNP